jgi:hypothetical protein
VNDGLYTTNFLFGYDKLMSFINLLKKKMRFFLMPRSVSDFNECSLF